jgi:hypothetical protein
MSQEINNREYRQKVIRDLLHQLHEGKSVEEVKAQFERAFTGVSATEISEAEQALIDGGLEVKEVQRLCDVHAAVFKGSIEDIHRQEDLSKIPGHPVHTLLAENRAVQTLIETQIRPALVSGASVQTLSDLLVKLQSVGVHYSKKENLLFPYLEKRGITAPPKVMWGVDDEIRAIVKSALTLTSFGTTSRESLNLSIEEALNKIEDMVFKEENILIPMLLDNLDAQQWQSIAEQSDQIGYCLIDPPAPFRQSAAEVKAAVQAEALPSAPDVSAAVGDVVLQTGALSIKELTAMLNTMPVDITFVDKDDTVAYFSEAKERIFPRTKSIIGRKVVNCHPPASVHIVEGIVRDLKSGKKDHEDFWIKMKDATVYIRYFAVRDDAGEFLGTLEVTQNIAPIQAITGEKRLVSV